MFVKDSVSKKFNFLSSHIVFKAKVKKCLSCIIVHLNETMCNFYWTKVNRFSDARIIIWYVLLCEKTQNLLLLVSWKLLKTAWLCYWLFSPPRGWNSKYVDGAIDFKLHKHFLSWKRVNFGIGNFEITRSSKISG